MLKKLFCSLLILLLLLNMFGGYWLFSAFQKQHNEELAEELDIDSYAGSQAITIKLPVSNYTGSDQENYERVDGEFIYEGIAYRMVKQKFYKDTAYIVCYKDEKAIAIHKAIKGIVDTFSEQPAKKSSEGKTAFSFIKDYLQYYRISFPEPNALAAATGNTIYLQYLICVSDLIIDHPPELIG